LAGHSARRLKQLNRDIAVRLVEKGGEVGAYVLSGAVITAGQVGLWRLIPASVGPKLVSFGGYRAGLRRRST
jgi:hypothetical protein